MAIPIYVICKAQGNTITSIGSELPKIEGSQILEGNIRCKYEKLGGIFHYHFKVKANKLFIGEETIDFNDMDVEVQINVRSHEGRKSTKLEYLILEDFKVQKEEKFSLKSLQELSYGIKVLNYDGKSNLESKMVLDYVKSNLFKVSDFKEVPTTSDINERIHKYILKAKEQNGDVYVLGDLYPNESNGKESVEEKFELLRKHGPRGIHDIHMNQGNIKKKKFVEHNGPYQDGALFIHYKNEKEDSWTAIFLKFKEQIIEERNNVQ